MSYAVENAKDNVRRDMLVILKPRIRVTSWTLDTGSVYYNDFSSGYVTAVSVNGVALALGGGSNLNAGEFYYSNSGQRLWIRKTSGTPQVSDWIVVTFEIHLATKDCYWHRDPLDSATDQVLWRGLITRTPSVSRSSADTIFGFSPTQSTQVSCLNDAELFQSILYDLTMNNCDVVIYHVAGDFDISNTVKLFTGIGGDFGFDDSEITFSILDKIFRFDKVMTNNGATLEFPTDTGTDGSSTDPRYYGAPIRSFYGDLYGVRGVCRDYADDGPTTSDNREWTFCTAQYGNLQDIAQIFLVIDGTSAYPLTLTTHYTITSLGSTSYGITLKTTVEAALGISTLSGATASVIANYVQGPEITPTVLGNPLGTYKNPVTILYHVLVDRFGLTQSDLNLPSFVTAAAAAPGDAIVLIPPSEHGSMPTYQEVITKLLATSLCRAFIDADGKFALAPVGLLETPADLSVTDDDISGVRFDYSYGDLVQVYFYNDQVEYLLRRSKADILAGTGGPSSFAPNQYYGNDNSTTDANTYIHQSDRTISVETYFAGSGSAGSQAYADQLADILSDRKGTLAGFISLGAHALELGDTVEVTRKKLPGFSYDGETAHSRKMIVSEIRKELTGVYVVLDDQKGIEENSGDW